MDAINEFIAKQTPDNNEQNNKSPNAPSPEQENSANEKLDNAFNSGKKEDLVNALNETSDTARKSSNLDLKKKKEKVEDKLGQVDKEELRNFIKEEVAKELAKFGIKKGDLSSESQQKLDELNNNNNNNNIKPEEAKNIRTEVLNEASVNALKKLISEVEQAIKSSEKEKIEAKVKKLRQFIEDTSDEYVQNAYREKKDKVNELLEKAKNQSSQNKENEGFFRLNNPVM